MNKIWIGGVLAFLSVAAVAQSDQSKEKAAAPAQTVSPRDAASGQASGKRMHKPMLVTNGDSSSRLLPTVNKVTSGDESQDKSSKGSDASAGKGETRVAAGDVNGDGAADANAKNSGHATEKATVPPASAGVTQPRDAATGQASGKRQYQPLPVRKEVEATSPKK